MDIKQLQMSPPIANQLTTNFFLQRTDSAARRFYFITYHAKNEMDSLITNMISQKYTIFHYAWYYERHI